MAELICVNTEEVSSALLKQSISGTETALSGLKSMSKGMSGLRCEWSTGNVSIFTSGITSGVSDAIRALNVAQAKLEQYAVLLDTGPSELIAVDQRYKNELTNWWERGSYSVQTWGESTLGYWVDNYEEKGWFYKTVHTIKEVAITGVAIAGVVAASSVCFPAAVLAVIYAGNTFANNITDIKNLWAENYDEVGKVNILESMLMLVGGKTGEMLGGEDGEVVGETIGRGVYDVGNLAVLLFTFKGAVAGGPTKIGNLGNRVKQSKLSMITVKSAVKEIPGYAKGLSDIFMHTPVNQVVYQYKLLSYMVPNIAEVTKDIKLLSEIGKLTSKLTTRGCKYLPYLVG